MVQLAKHDQSLELAHVFFAAKRTGFVPVLYQFRTTRHKRNAKRKSETAFQRTVSELPQFLPRQVFVTESCLPVNRPHENPEKRP
jgi:hypothetical protein